MLQSIVSEMADAFVGVGLADAGTYQENYKGAPVIACRVFITRNVAPFGSFGSVNASQAEIGILLSEIPKPARGATINADGQIFTLVEMIRQDDAISTWSVRP